MAKTQDCDWANCSFSDGEGRLLDVAALNPGTTVFPSPLAISICVEQTDPVQLVSQ